MLPNKSPEPRVVCIEAGRLDAVHARQIPPSQMRYGACLVALLILVSACQTQTSTQIVPIKRLCALHGKPMFLGPPVSSSLPFRYDATSEYKLAAQKQFPNVGEKFVVGCIPPYPKRLPRVKFCEKCRADEAEWIRSHRLKEESSIRRWMNASVGGGA